MPSWLSLPYSSHCRGDAIDIADVGHKIANQILAKPELLKKYGLWIEDTGSTPTWTHLDQHVRTDRPLRMFKP